MIPVQNLTLLLLNTTCPVLANSVDPDQLAYEEANWSGSALFVVKYVNFYQKPESSNLIGWKLEAGVASKFIQHDMSSNCLMSGKQCRPDQTPRSAASDQVYTVCQDLSVQKQKIHKVHLSISCSVLYTM